jgi:hypothetical protein
VPGVRDTDSLQGLLASYPKARGWTIVANWITSREPRSSFTLAWPALEDRRVNRDLSVMADWFDRAWWLRPAVGDTAVVPTVLVCWWALLLALATLARYERATWRRALNIDTSPLARTLEEGLDIALDRIPELLLDAIVAPRTRRS